MNSVEEKSGDRFTKKNILFRYAAKFKNICTKDYYSSEISGDLVEAQGVENLTKHKKSLILNLRLKLLFNGG